ncbi:anaphase-promoting complex subunit 4 [Marchantia polymorpha subsp. ruderalis]|uniref:Anaphase-promoting complex subunit 4 n=2 Tax=Marchantia polymorpha TaxID=3197 RepID=A0AAF6BTK8_MARPO|nr:hypothetical protein MARPO_0038s0098 [Marchantia polymorpha]BBN15342.1 hypothetical protein Mp_6g18880 [Marchantia polymorpha subsp. ruderalis]PTQ40776.1 hypothetical protein MARPO_0038s0098 [Marchantia polymorpha]PTQ40777.1 hypothetical protein MARPO_0038s0098 [Marchantia polymorpha]PTQ40778.1 hypothetical protein MARPO_0038s0098 [Marchantia polymorpha]|eukprot:PTQ40775.1 hypothetical protein MARPO_0038s0098 [Marchantia polymorpha]
MSFRDSQEDVVMDDQADAEDTSGTLSFSLLLDKSLPSLVVIAAWNPGKDLLAMVTMDHQLIVHRLNWQRLWAISPDLTVTSICWRPDGKALAVGHINGSIAIHDVENGDVLRKTGTHQVAVECLYWAEEGQNITDNEDEIFLYEDRTPRFFPPPPKPPSMPGTAPSFDMSSVLGSAMEDLGGGSLKGATQDVKHGLDVLCSGDKDGVICLSAFGVFPIGKLDVRELVVNEMASGTKGDEKSSEQLLNASAFQVSLSSDLRHMTVVCTGTSTVDGRTRSTSSGNYCLSVNTAILGDRRKELRQVALQASSIEELIDVLQTSLSVMEKQWSEAITAVYEKFNGFTQLLREHGSNVSPQDELLGLLTCGYASPALHQFLAASVGEGGLKRLAKSIDTASKELYSVLSEHMQPAAEIIAFRLGELRGLARWHARLACVGLEESLMDRALEHAGMLLVQLERLLRIVSETTGGFRLFFVWLLKALRQLNRETLSQAETLPNVDSMAVANFLQTDFEKDPIGLHLSNSVNVIVDVPKEIEELMDEVAAMGGFKDSKFLQRTLAQEIDLLTICCHEAFAMPLKVVSPQLGSPCMILLCNTAISPIARIPVSSTYFEIKQDDGVLAVEQDDELLVSQYICFRVNDNGSPDDPSVVGILRGFGPNHGSQDKRIFREAVSFQLDSSLRCNDIALYKQRQLVLLVTERDLETGDWTGQTWIMLLQLDDLPFHILETPESGANLDLLHLCSSKGSPSDISLRHGKVRALPQSDVVMPLAVSASRGLACVFTSQRRVFLYDLEEDEEAKDEDME